MKTWFEQAQERGLITGGKSANLEAILALSEISVNIPELPEGISESAFEKAVVGVARANGFRVAHFGPARVVRKGKEKYETPNRYDSRGFPDLVMIRRVGLVGRMVVAELKVGDNQTPPHQREWIADFMSLMVAGSVVEVYVWRETDWSDIVKTLTRK